MTNGYNATHVRGRGFREEGAAAIWAIAVTAGAFTLLLGLVVDGGHLINDRLEAARTAQQAARVGADALSAASVRSGGDAVDAAAAADQARGYLEAADMAGTIRVDEDAVTVTVTGTSRTRILGVIGIASFPVQESATARGITEGDLP